MDAGPGRVVGRSWRCAIAVSGADTFVRWHVPPAAVREVRTGAVDSRGWWAVRFAAMSYWEDGGVLVSGDPAAVAEVAVPLARATGAADLTVPAAVGTSAAVGLDPARTDGWAWMHTTRPLPPTAAEDPVAWDPPAPDVDALLDRANPGAFVRPGHPRVRRWAGLREEDGTLLACGAVTAHAPGVPHLAAITTHPAARGRGLGAALTAAITRSLLRRHAAVSLALWASNDTARRLYTRLGFTGGHDYLSGPLP